MCPGVLVAAFALGIEVGDSDQRIVSYYGSSSP
jgi:hypothetical protein